MKKELERKNLDYAEQIDEIRMLVENNDELNDELDKIKVDLDETN